MSTTVQYTNVYYRSTSASEAALYINKSQGMALSAGVNITGLNHTLQQLITQLTLYKLELPEKVPKTEILIECLHIHSNKNDVSNFCNFLDIMPYLHHIVVPTL